MQAVNKRKNTHSLGAWFSTHIELWQTRKTSPARYQIVDLKPALTQVETSKGNLNFQVKNC